MTKGARRKQSALCAWLDTHHPGRGGRSYLRLSGVAFATIAKAIEGVPIRREAAELLSSYTGGAVSVASMVAPDEAKKKSRAA